MPKAVGRCLTKQQVVQQILQHHIAQLVDGHGQAQPIAVPAP